MTGCQDHDPSAGAAEADVSNWKLTRRRLPIATVAVETKQHVHPGRNRKAIVKGGADSLVRCSFEGVDDHRPPFEVDRGIRGIKNLYEIVLISRACLASACVNLADAQR